jgi:alkaline phosphatase D
MQRYILYSFILLVGLFAAFAYQRSASATEELPQVTHGPISGEVSASGITLWARGDRNGILTFVVSAADTPTQTIASAEVAIDEVGDFTGEVRIEGLTPSTEYIYTVTLTADGKTSSPLEGRFRTAPAAEAKTGFDFVFGACLGGQGYCRDVETGWAIFDAMAATQPDFFVLTGDGIYAGGTCPTPQNAPGAEQPVRNLEDFRARYRYHLEDPAYASFLAQTPVFVGWDDHELRDNYAGPELASWNPQRLQDGRQAFFEYWPVSTSDILTDTYRLYRQFSYGSHADFFMLDTRSYRDPIVNWDPHPRTLKPKTMLGAEQKAWLKRNLLDSTATWKFIITSVPLSWPTGFPQPEVEGRDGWANFTERSGYETELMELLFFIVRHNIQNVVFLTGDTHWPFAISYDPDQDGVTDFYEFGSSPMSALVLAPPSQPDPSFNPTVLYAEGEFQGDLFNFGQISVSDEGVLTFRIYDRAGTIRYELSLEPAP